MGWQIELRRVNKVFDERVVLRDISATVNAPGAWTILGPNGSGKSTLLRIIAGLLTPTQGEVLYLHNGERLSAHQRRQAVGMVAPDIALYRPLTALENLRFFAKARGLPVRDSDLLWWLERVQLRSRAHDPVSAFSTGMVQRLKLLTALVHRPPVLLLDEPGSNLDETGMKFIRETVREQAQHGIVIIATNDSRELGYGEPLIQLGK
ncbi:MAG: heme ABC exporter ATP-binding protein CcmA [Armatimonadota bacterium]|nr:MAG: heme ABC exporter ATP-binding protein CcmA [Armatimonadota bacterium]